MEILIDRVTKQYKNKIVIDHITQIFHCGVYGLLGENGAGKTTLMRMICGILEPSSGQIRLNGKAILELGESYREVLGYLPQDFGYYPNFTAMEFLLYIASLKGLSKIYGQKRSKELLGLVGLEQEAKHKIKTFSGGMRQRLGIAQALLNDSDILVLDEPTAGLDPKERVRFRNLIANLGTEKIVLLSTHIVSDVEAIADEILLLKQGQIIASGSVEELKQVYEKNQGKPGNLEDLYLTYFQEEQGCADGSNHEKSNLL